MNKYLPVLKNCPLFKNLSDEDIVNSLKCMNAQLIKKKKDEYIIHAGSTIDSIGLIVQGSALIVQDDLWGNRNIVANLSPGNFYGEPFASIPGTVMNLSVVATKDCEIFLLGIDKLLNMCTNSCSYHNEIIRNLVNVMADKILMLNDKITHTSKRKTRDKLLSYLSAESIRQNSLNFDITYNRQQLADFLCVERSAMTNELSKLQDEGYITTHRSHFELHTEL